MGYACNYPNMLRKNKGLSHVGLEEASIFRQNVILDMTCPSSDSFLWVTRDSFEKYIYIYLIILSVLLTH